MESQATQSTMSLVEKTDLVLSVINDMNVSATKVIKEIVQLSKITDMGHNYDSLIQDMNVIQGGISTMHNIYMQARQRAVAAEELSEKNQTQLKEIQELRDAKATHAVTEVPELMQRLGDSLKDSLQRLDGFTVTTNKAEQKQTVGDVAAKLIEDIQPKESVQTNIDKLIGRDGLLYGILSNQMHPDGRGFLKPNNSLMAYQESIKNVDIGELADWPSGFYNCGNSSDDCAPCELYLKINEVEFLWIFKGDPVDLCVRKKEDAWKGINYFTKSQVSLFINIIDSYFNELKHGGVIDYSAV